MNIVNNDCVPKSRCKKIKKCKYCARIRQAQIANLAEEKADKKHSLYYCVIKPKSNFDHIKSDKNKFIKSLTRRQFEGIWTIEEGKELNTAHINILFQGQEKEITREAIKKKWEATTKREATTWLAEVSHREIRQIAAYIAKQSQIPNEKNYRGKTYGSFGNWRKPLQFKSSAPHVNALIYENQLKEAIPIPPDNTQTKKEIDKYLPRTLAILRNKIRIKGYIYAEGLGIVGIDDLMRHKLITQVEFNKLSERFGSARGLELLDKKDIG